MPTKKKSHEGEADAPADTPPQRPTGVSEDAVIAPEGVTEPTKVYLGDGVTPVPPGEAPTPKPKTSAAAGELFQGFFNLTGNTFHGKEITDLNTFIPTPITKEGIYNVFRSHHPDAIEEGFSFEVANPTPPPAAQE